MRNMYFEYFFLLSNCLHKKSAFISSIDKKALLKIVACYKRNDHDIIGIGNQFLTMLIL
jgi:hypothetical protein